MLSAWMYAVTRVAWLHRVGAPARAHRAGHRPVRARSRQAAGDDEHQLGPRRPARSTPPALEGIDAVVHLAGAGIGDKKWTDERKRLILESRARRAPACSPHARGTRRTPPRALVSASAIGYYGNRGDEVLTEESAPGDDFVAGVVRAVGSGDAAGGRRRDPRGATSARGIVLGRARAACCTRMLLPFKLGLGGRIGFGQAST